MKVGIVGCGWVSGLHVNAWRDIGMSVAAACDVNEKTAMQFAEKYAIKIKRIKALPILIIPLGVCFSAVYLGEHYVIDLLAGVAYSTVAFFLVEKLITRFSLHGRSVQISKRRLRRFRQKSVDSFSA